MKKITTQLIAIFVLVITKQIHAQENFKDILYRINNVENIFEGTVIKSQPYTTTNDKFIYTSNIIQISKVFKGQLKCGTVELITEGGSFGDRSIESSHTLQLSVGATGIFLANLTSREKSLISYYPVNNYEQLEAYFENQSFFKYWSDGEKTKVSDLYYNLDSLAQLYDLTEFLTQINYVDCNNLNISMPTTNTYQDYKNLPYDLGDFTPSKSLDYDAYLQLVQNRVTTQNSSRANETVTYSIVNPVITGTNPKFFEFDVNVAADNSLYLASALARIEYPSAAFGSNVFANNKIQVSRGSIIADASEYSGFGGSDVSPNIIAIGVIANPTPSGLSSFSSLSNQLFHVKIEIQNCNTNSTVAFTQQPTMLTLSNYETTPTGNNNYPFDNINATQSVTIPACKTTITSFSPQIVRGGVGDVLEIRGFQFGPTKGNGNVIMKNADNGGLSEIALDNYDFVSWSDTLIKLIIPSVDTGNVQNPVGTGRFKVISNAGSADSSATPLTIFYSLFNYQDSSLFSGSKKRSYMYNKDGNGGYKFYIDTSVSNKPLLLSCVREAMNNWVCETGVKFTIVGDTFGLSTLPQDDDINLISLGNSLPATTLARTTNYTGFCNATQIYMNTGIDIFINRNFLPSFFYDTTGLQNVPPNQIDAYHTMLHEWGHAVKHLHINDQNALMFFDSKTPRPAGVSSSNRGVRLWLENSGVTGGQYSVTTSASFTNVTGCSLTPMQPVNTNLCSQFVSIKESQTGDLKVTITPNPFHGNLDISVGEINFDTQLTLHVINAQGMIVDKKTINASDVALDNQFTYNGQHLPAGIFFVSLELNGKRTVKKLIHLNEH